VQPPSVGLLWTPGYWGFVGGVYAFNAGYWGPHVGFYGGVNYGFGYVGVGFGGGRWVGGAFAYNQAVTNVNVTIVHNTYNETVVHNTTVNRVSFNGGTGGIRAAPTPQERAAAREQHVPPTPIQHQHVQEAAKIPTAFAKANGGHPPIAATPKPAAFHAPGVVGAHGAATPPHPASAEQTRAAHPQAPAAGTRPPAGAPPKPNQPKPGAKPAAPKPPPKAPPAKHEPEGENK
jgi:hypothetical protein